MQSSWRFWYLLLLLALLASGIGYGLKMLRSSSPRAVVVAPPAESNPSPDHSAGTSNDSELHEVTAAERAAATQQPAVVHHATRPIAAPLSKQSRLEPTPLTRQLVSGLANLDFTHGSI